MRRTLSILWTALRVLLAAAVIMLLFYNAYVLVRRTLFHDAMPTLFGYTSAVVISGSMEPEIGIDDLVIVHAEDEYAVGDIIMFEKDGAYVTHRIIAAEGGSYLTQGDANNVSDGYTPHENVVGKVVAVWGGIGGVVTFMQTPAGIFLLIAAVVIIWFVLDLVAGKRSRRAISEENGSEKDEA